MLALALLCVSSSRAQSDTPSAAIAHWGSPRVETFYPRDTGVSGKIHSFSTLPNGELAILTSAGYFTFDGTNWEQIPGLIWAYHSLLDPEKKEAVVAYRDGLARLTPDPFGSYQIKPIANSEKYPSGLPSLENVATARNHYFGLTGPHLVIVDPQGDLAVQRLPNWATTCFAIGDEIYVTGGIENLLAKWNWETNALNDVTNMLDGAGVYDWIVKVTPRKEGGVWLLTQNNNIIAFDGTSTKLWPGSATIAQHEARVTCFVETTNGALAIGTSNHGLLVIEHDGRIRLQYSKRHDLDDVYIQQAGIDPQGGIWIATENSITRVPSESQSILFNENHGLAEDIKSLILFHGHLYLGTSRGLYVDNPNAADMDETFVLLKEHNDIQDMIAVDDALFITGGSTLIMSPDQEFQEFDHAGSTNLHQPSRYPNVVLAGNFRGILRFEKRNGKWTFVGALDGPEQDIYNIAEDQYGNLFGSLGNSYIARIHLTDTGGHFENILLPNPTNGSWSTPVNIEGDIYVNTEPTLRWDQQAQFFVSDPEMIYYPGAPPYGFEQVYGRSAEDAYVAINARSGQTVPRPIKQVIGDISSIGFSIDTRANCIAQSENGYIWAGGSFGVILANNNAPSPTTKAIKPRLNRIYLTKDQSPLPIVATAENPIVLKHSQNSIQFEIEFPNFNATGHHLYQIHVEGIDESWSKFSDTAWRELNNLRPGDYILQVNSIDATGHTYSADDYYFRILQPWYAETWAFVLYLVTLVLIIVVIVRYYNRAQINRARHLHKLVQERTKEIESKNAELQQQATILEKQNEELEDKTEELTTTTESLTQTLNQLQEMQDQLVATARTAGKAEIAINVLHNVGNVLNSLNVSVNVLSERTQGSNAIKLTRIAGLVEKHKENITDFIASDPRGKNVPNYLIQLSKALEEEVATNLHELGIMNDDIDHIKSVIAAQQTHAKSNSIIEEFPIRELCETALSIVGNERTKTHIEVINDVPESITLTNDKHRLLDIILNLISNALDAIDEQMPEIGVLTLQARHDPESGEIVFSVNDNGTGITPENQEKLFRHGFTTKANGHGFGLHSCANAANVIGGKLILTSPGVGRGATATLTLPANYTPTASTSTPTNNNTSIANSPSTRPSTHHPAPQNN